MKRLNRILSATLVISLICSLGASCGKKKESENGRMKIDWLMYCDGPMDKNSPVEKYFEDYFDVDFNVWYIERSKWDELLNIRIATGEVPDVFMALSAKSFLNYVNQDILAEVPEEKIREVAPKIAGVVDGYDPERRELCNTDI